MPYRPTITLIQNGDALEASVLNAPLTTLAGRTDYLRSVQATLNQRSALYLDNAEVDPGVATGSLLAYNPSTGRHEAALAAWDDSLEADGSLKVSWSAIVSGVLLERRTTTTALILLPGSALAFDASTAFGSSTPDPGVWWLSATSPGSATMATPLLRVRVAHVQADGVVRLLSEVFSETHDHRSVSVAPSQWVDCSSDAYKPVGASWSVALSGLLSGGWTNAAVLTDNTGAVVDTSYFTVLSGKLYWMDDTAPVSDVVLHASVPFGLGPNVVRALASGTPGELMVTSSNGLATISNLPWTSTTGAVGGMAVMGINGRNLLKGQVVQSISASNGIEASNNNGAVSLSLSSNTWDVLHADVVNLDSALEIYDEDMRMIVFPKGRISSLRATVACPMKGMSTHVSCHVWLWVRGTGVSVPALTVKVWGQGRPPVAFNATGTTSTISTATPASGQLVKLSTSTGAFTVPDGGLVNFKITANGAPTDNIRVLSVGLGYDGDIDI